MDETRKQRKRPRTSICTSLSGQTSFELASKASRAFDLGTDLVEFRIDFLSSPTFEKIKGNLSKFSERSIFAVRPAAEGGGFQGSEAERLALLRRLVELRPAFLDVELRTLESNHGQLKDLGLNMIVSWHDLANTPERSKLRSIASRAASHRGLVKIVTTAKSPVDNLTILSLYDEPGPPPIAFCMGALGVFSRVMALERRSPMAYASLPGEPTAPGQLSIGQLLALRRQLESA